MAISGRFAPQTIAHVAFAVGAMPLIHAAIAYFVPVLTRGNAGGAISRWPPLLALGGGCLAVAAFVQGFSGRLIAAGAILASLAAASLATWGLWRLRNMVGRRHPGMDWYLAALGFLVIALAAALLGVWLPGMQPPLRLFHLHANLLGFIGLTALGTVQVLLPTCIGKADDEAVTRLRTDLRWAVFGALLISIGASGILPRPLAAASSVVAALGGVCYGAVVLRLLNAWRVRFGSVLFAAHGTQASLFAATVGLFVVTCLGFAHGATGQGGRSGVVGFVVAFLLPLVSGAVAQLLPVWLRPGPQGEWHAFLRRRLSRYSAARAWTLVAAGLWLATG